MNCDLNFWLKHLGHAISTHSIALISDFAFGTCVNFKIDNTFFFSLTIP